MFLEVKRVPANYPTWRGLAKATRYRPRSRLTFQVKKIKVTDIGNNLETEQNSPIRVGIYWKFNIYLTDRIGCLGCYPCLGVYHPSGQTTIFAQGVIAFSISAQRKKGLVHFYNNSCVSHSVEYWVLIAYQSNIGAYIFYYRSCNIRTTRSGSCNRRCCL